MFKDADKSLALVTGASRGIGAAVAGRLNARGYEVVGTRRKILHQSRARRQVDSQAEWAFLEVDLADPRDTSQMVDRLLKQFGLPDVVVHAAGVGHFGAIANVTLEQWEAMIGVNLTSAYVLCRELLPLMKERGYGHIVGISSALEATSSANAAGYAASKHGLKALFDGVANEHRGTGVIVSRIVPSSVKTNFGGFSPDDKAGALEPMDVADAVVGVLGLSSRVTSATLLLEGATIFEPSSWNTGSTNDSTSS